MLSSISSKFRSLSTHPRCCSFSHFHLFIFESEKGKRQQESTNFMFMKINFPSLRWYRVGAIVRRKQDDASIIYMMTADINVKNIFGWEKENIFTSSHHNDFEEFRVENFPLSFLNREYFHRRENILALTWLFCCYPCVLCVVLIFGCHEMKIIFIM